MSEPGAIIDIVNPSISLPFIGAQENDVILKTTHPTQRIVFAISNNPVLALSNQNVGIGTLTPTSKLHVEGDVAVNGTLVTTNPMPFTGLVITRTTASPPTNVGVAARVDGLLKDANGNIAISTKANGFISYSSGSNELMRITSNAFIGIGTSNPPYRLTIVGSNASLNGPHIATYTSTDNYPLMQFLSWSHNAIFMTMDGYYDGTNWKASHNTSFQIGKSNNHLSIGYSSGNLQGSNTAYTSALVINSNGMIGINTTNPTSQLTVNGDISVQRIISPLFRAIQVFDNVQGPLSGKTSSTFTLGGGTLHLRGGYSLYNNANATSRSTLTLTLRDNTTPVSTISSTYYFNQINDHRAFSITRTLSNIPSGTYNITVTLSGTTGTTSDVNDYLSLTITEYPF